jgi:hypothetical protein
MATAVTLCDTVVTLPLRYKESVNVTQTVHESMETTTLFNGNRDIKRNPQMRNVDVTALPIYYRREIPGPVALMTYDETSWLPNKEMTKPCEVSDETSTNLFPHF